MSVTTILAVIALLLTVLGLLLAYFVRKTSAWDEIVRRLTIIETRFEILWNSFTHQLVDVLHQPDVASKIPDELLDQFRAGTISDEGLANLSRLMQEVVRDKSLSLDEREKAAAMMILITGYPKLRQRNE